jgi:hypothetical protein
MPQVRGLRSKISSERKSLPSISHNSCSQGGRPDEYQPEYQPQDNTHPFPKLRRLSSCARWQKPAPNNQKKPEKIGAATTEAAEMMTNCADGAQRHAGATASSLNYQNTNSAVESSRAWPEEVARNSSKFQLNMLSIS